ncbi:MAG: hypothetical protein C0392_01565 [Syntrophus sp. (in: bacteria)]|nr:hypothetical protein [Syntrophus sp. (in: bacteria)]
MPKILAENLKPGMILSKPVTNASGILILPEETELTDSLIRKIHNMDIEAVYIKGEQGAGSSLDQMLVDLDRRFSNVETAPYMDVLKRVVKKHMEDLYG